MDQEYMDLSKRFIKKLESELSKLNCSPLSTELEIKEAIVDYCKDNNKTQIMHIDFLSALYEQDNSLDYIYQNAKEIPITRLIGKSSKGVINLAEVFELVGDDAYCEKVDIQRMQKVDGHAYFIRKPTSFVVVDEHTKSYESRNSSQKSPYHVFVTIKLDAIKYDDFINNRLGHTHQFIADHAEGCSENKFGIVQCIRVLNKDNPDESMLIQSEGYDYARYAAVEIKPKELEKKKTNNRNLER